MATLAPDLKLAARFLEAHPPRGRVLLAAITGAHHYGFPSPDSDLDIKGIHAAPARTVLGLGEARLAHDRLEIFEGVECDLTSNELRQALRLLVSGNGNMLERLLSPFQLVRSPELPELQALARGALSRRFFGHYRGFFRAVRKRAEAADPTVKSVLYAYRVACTGVLLLERGELSVDLRESGPELGFELSELIELKQRGAEKGPMPKALYAEHARAFELLKARLEQARERSPLPEQAANREAVEDFLVDLRAREL